MTESKALLRRLLRETSVTVDEKALCSNILSHPWFLASRTVMAYSAIPPEIDLQPVLEAVLAQGKTLLMPRCERDGTMTARVIPELSFLEKGSYGIMEPPEHAELFPAGEIDLVLVPGLAFDPKGRRLGRGKGYYDRFLPDCGGKTMGICRCLISEVPVEKHDIIMDAVVTANAIFYGMEDDACFKKS